MTLLGDAAKAAMPGFDPERQSVYHAGQQRHSSDSSGIVLPNPLKRLPEQLYTVVETKMSIIHGDLNLQNILVDGPTGFSWLIDFAETRYGPDIARHSAARSTSHH